MLCFKNVFYIISKSLLKCCKIYISYILKIKIKKI
jgi:hypothetical protein